MSTSGEIINRLGFLFGEIHNGSIPVDDVRLNDKDAEMIGSHMHMDVDGLTRYLWGAAVTVDPGLRPGTCVIEGKKRVLY